MSDRDDFTEFDGEPLDPQSAELQRALVAMDREYQADDDFTPDTDDSRAITLVKEREGRDLLADATDPAREARELDAEGDENEEDLSLPAPAETQQDKPEAARKEQIKPEPLPLDVTALMKVIPAPQREQVKAMAQQARQWGEIEQIVAPFAGELKAHGETVLDGIRTLASLNSFATQNPGGYMAWFTARVLPPENRAEALIQLGKAVGVKLVEDEFGLDDDDEAAAKAAPPQNPEVLRQQHDADMLIASFEQAEGPGGVPAHPLFNSDHPLSGAVHRAMTKAIAADVQAGQPRPATIAEMRTYYDRAVADISATLPGDNKAQQKVDKAKRASAPITSPPAAPRRSTASTKPDRDDGGSSALLAGLRDLYGTGAET